MVHPIDAESKLYEDNLNTSYVMVHHPCRVMVILQTLFKYILCYGSSWIITTAASRLSYLNTSYVMVHLKKIGVAKQNS